MKQHALYIFCGLPFSGKTTLAKELENKFGLTRVDLDEVKKEHGFGDKSDDEVTFEQWTEIFDDYNSRIETLMKHNKGIISDISNLERSERDNLRKIASKFNYPNWVIYINTPENVARERWLKNKESKERFDLTEKVFNEAVEALEKPTEDEDVITLDYRDSVDNWIKTLLL